MPSRSIDGEELGLRYLYVSVEYLSKRKNKIKRKCAFSFTQIRDPLRRALRIKF